MLDATIEIRRDGKYTARTSSAIFVSCRSPAKWLAILTFKRRVLIAGGCEFCEFFFVSRQIYGAVVTETHNIREYTRLEVHSVQEQARHECDRAKFGEAKKHIEVRQRKFSTIGKYTARMSSAVSVSCRLDRAPSRSPSWRLNQVRRSPVVANFVIRQIYGAAVTAQHSWVASEIYSVREQTHSRRAWAWLCETHVGATTEIHRGSGTLSWQSPLVVVLIAPSWRLNSASMVVTSTASSFSCFGRFTAVIGTPDTRGVYVARCV